MSSMRISASERRYANGPAWPWRNRDRLSIKVPRIHQCQTDAGRRGVVSVDLSDSVLSLVGGQGIELRRRQTPTRLVGQEHCLETTASRHIVLEEGSINGGPTTGAEIDDRVRNALAIEFGAMATEAGPPSCTTSDRSATLAPTARAGGATTPSESTASTNARTIDVGLRPGIRADSSFECFIPTPKDSLARRQFRARHGRNAGPAEVASVAFRRAFVNCPSLRSPHGWPERVMAHPAHSRSVAWRVRARPSNCPKESVWDTD